MIDLNSKTALGDRINHYLDAGLVERDAKEERRAYLGGSRIGEECERQLQYEFEGANRDEGHGFEGRILRIFERGHWAEEKLVEWLGLGGFTISTEWPGGRGQYGFEAGPDGLFRGHTDGILVDGPAEFAPWPRLWEAKCVGAKYWRAIVKRGIRRERPTYYAQVQVYQRHLRVTAYPAWFVAVNADTMELHWEEVPHDPAFAASLDVKASRVIEASLHGDRLPRAYKEPSFYRCKFCDWAARCWSGGGR